MSADRFYVTNFQPKIGCYYYYSHLTGSTYMLEIEKVPENVIPVQLASVFEQISWERGEVFPIVIYICTVMRRIAFFNGQCGAAMEIYYFRKSNDGLIQCYRIWCWSKCKKIFCNRSVLAPMQ